jgi:hypothetical protein
MIRVMKATAVLSVGACLAIVAGCGDGASHSPTGTSGLSAPGAGQLRGAVLDGARTDFRRTRVHRRFIACFLASLGRELTARQLNTLVETYRERGQAFAAQELNARAAPVGDACGGRRDVPELVEASKALRGGAGASADERSGQLAVQYGPDIGVACRQANSVRCDRLGLDVVLQEPATQVSASIASRPIHVVTPGPVSHASARGRDWGGYLRDAGFTRRGSPLFIRTEGSRGRWAGEPPVHVDIRITATYRSGRTLTKVFRRVNLRPGWG